MKGVSRVPLRGGRRVVGSARAVVVSLTCCCAMLVCFVMLLCILPAPVAAGKKAKEDDGPRLEVLSRSLPREVAPGVPIVVHARIDPGKEDGPDRSSFTGAHRVRGIALIYRFGFNAETRVEMRDDGVSPDQYADDGVYVSVIRTGDQGWPGGMVRWRAEATLATEPSGGGTANNNKRVLQAPPFTGAKSARYFGTVLGGRNHSTDLDVMHVFARDEKAMTTDEGTPVSLAFLGRFYDNVRVRRRGSGRGEKVVGVTLPPKDWPKHKLKFDFKGNVFHWSEDGDVAPVEEFNLQSHYQEPGEETYMRENLAAAVFAEAGVPAPAVFHVQVRLNGRYHGLFSFVEQVDAAFLKRWRLDPKGDMYKAVHWKYSNLRSPDIKAKCPWATPDWPNLWAERDGYCPEVWRVKGKGAAAKALDEAEKLEEKVKAGALRGDAANAKIEALRDASMAPMRELTKTLERAAAWGAAANAGKVAADGKDDVGARLLLDVLDIPAVINEMAAQTLVLSVDRCTKNYYMWRRIPWDLEDAFPVDYRDGIRTCDAAVQCAANETQYCLLTCEKFNSVFFCDRNHPQDIFVSNKPGDESASTYNVMVDAVLASSQLRSMYLRRLRTLMDLYLATDYFDELAMSYLERIKDDAWRDSEKWGVGSVRGIQQGVLQLRTQALPARRRQLFSEQTEVPGSQPPDAVLQFGALEVAAVDPKQAFVELINTNSYAVDISGWILFGGGIKHTMRPGTVLAPGIKLAVVKDPKVFRSRAVSPRAGQGYLIQGPFKGELDFHSESDDDKDNDGSSGRYDMVPASLHRGRASRTVTYRPVVLQLVTPEQRVAAVAAVRLMSRTGGITGHALLRGRLDEAMTATTGRDLSVGRSRNSNITAEATASSSASTAETMSWRSSPSSVMFTGSQSSCVSPTFSQWFEWGECCTPGARSRCGVFCGEPSASRGRRRDILWMPPMNDRNRLPCLEPTSEVDNTCAAAPCLPPEPPKRCAISESAASIFPPTATMIVATDGLSRVWEDWSWSATLEKVPGAGITAEVGGVGLKATLTGGGAVALRTARLPVLDSEVVLSAWMARSQPLQPPPNVDVQLEIQWHGARSKNGTMVSDAMAATLPKVFGSTLDWDLTAVQRGSSSANVFDANTSHDTWSEGCYAEVSMPVGELRSRRRDSSELDAFNPWMGQTLKSTLLTATSGVVVDIPVKVILQNRAGSETIFYLGRLTLEDTKDVERRYEIQDWLNAMQEDERDRVMTMLKWGVDLSTIQLQAQALPPT